MMKGAAARYREWKVSRDSVTIILSHLVNVLDIQRPFDRYEAVRLPHDAHIKASRPSAGVSGVETSSCVFRIAEAPAS